MYYLTSILTAKHLANNNYPTKIDIYANDYRGSTSVSMIFKFNETDRYLVEIVRIGRYFPTYSTDFEKFYNTYKGAKKGLLHWLHQFDHDNYKYDNKDFQKILTIMNEDHKEITVEYILKKADYAHHLYNISDGDNFTYETIYI